MRGCFGIPPFLLCDNPIFCRISHRPPLFITPFEVIGIIFSALRFPRQPAACSCFFFCFDFFRFQLQLAACPLSVAEFVFLLVESSWNAQLVCCDVCVVSCCYFWRKRYKRRISEFSFKRASCSLWRLFFLPVLRSFGWKPWIRRFRVVQVNRANAKGETALMHGAASGSIKIVRMLVKVKASFWISFVFDRESIVWIL